MLRVKSVPVPLPLNWSGTSEDSSQIRSLEASLAYVDTSTQELYHHHTHLYIQHSGCPCSTWCGLLPWRHRHRGWRLGNQNVSTGPWNDKHTLIATDSLRVGKLRQLLWRHLLSRAQIPGRNQKTKGDFRSGFYNKGFISTHKLSNLGNNNGIDKWALYLPSLKYL